MLTGTQKFRLIIKDKNGVQSIVANGVKIEAIYKRLIKAGISEDALAIVWA
jgi:hypothetical protein